MPTQSRGHGTRESPLHNRTLAIALALLIASVPSAAAQEAPPRVGDERIVLHTVGGHLVLALYPDVAPKHVEQLLKLTRLGVFNGTHFSRVEPNFVVQLSTAHDRSFPLTGEQRAAIAPIPAEFSKLKHRRGTLSMAREDNKPDSGETSFSILLADSPHLDGQYTVFGHVESGMDVIPMFLDVPRRGAAPVVRLEVLRSEVATAEQLKTKLLVPPQKIIVPPQLLARLQDTSRQEVAAIQKERAAQGITFLVCALAVMMLISALPFLLANKLSPRMLASISMMNLLVGGFTIFTMLVPIGQTHQAMSAVMFLSLLGLFKLMGRFESAA